MLTTTTNEVVYRGTGSGVTFSIPFPIHSRDCIEAFLLDGKGLETRLLPGVDCLVEEAEGLAELVLLGEPLAEGHILAIRRRIPLTQEVELHSQGPNSAKVTENALDKLTMIAQQLDGQLRRLVGLPPPPDDGKAYLATAGGWVEHLDPSASEAGAASSSSVMAPQAFSPLSASPSAPGVSAFATATPAEPSSPMELRREAYQRETDGILNVALGYRAEAEGWEQAGNGVKAVAATAKARHHLRRYVEARDAIRRRYPDPEPRAYYLTNAGTYHLAGCPHTSAVGEWLTLEGIAERNAAARPCLRCGPLAEEGDGDGRT